MNKFDLFFRLSRYGIREDIGSELSFTRMILGRAFEALRKEDEKRLLDWAENELNTYEKMGRG